MGDERSINKNLFSPAGDERKKAKMQASSSKNDFFRCKKLSASRDER